MISDIEKQIETIVEQRLANIVRDPRNVIAAYQKLLEEQNPKIEAYDRFLDATGLVNCAKAADAVEIYYVDPVGKKQRMGSKYFIGVLAHDGIIYKDKDGYRISARYKEYGITKMKETNGMMKSSVLFNARGVAYLVNRYKNDTRVWRSQDGRLSYSMGLPKVGRESQEPHLQVEESLG